MDQDTALVPLSMEDRMFSEEAGELEYKHRYRLNLNPGTSRHLLESTNEISIAHVGTEQGVDRLKLKVKVTGKTRVVHEAGDHATIYLPPGQHKVRVALEFDPWTRSSVAVFD